MLKTPPVQRSVDRVLIGLHVRAGELADVRVGVKISVPVWSIRLTVLPAAYFAGSTPTRIAWISVGGELDPLGLVAVGVSLVVAECDHVVVAAVDEVADAGAAAVRVLDHVLGDERVRADVDHVARVVDVADRLCEPLRRIRVRLRGQVDGSGEVRAEILEEGAGGVIRVTGIRTRDGEEHLDDVAGLEALRDVVGQVAVWVVVARVVRDRVDLDLHDRAGIHVRDHSAVHRSCGCLPSRTRSRTRGRRRRRRRCPTRPRPPTHLARSDDVGRLARLDPGALGDRDVCEYASAFVSGERKRDLGRRPGSACSRSSASVDALIDAVALAPAVTTAAAPASITTPVWMSTVGRARSRLRDADAEEAPRAPRRSRRHRRSRTRRACRC